MSIGTARRGTHPARPKNASSRAGTRPGGRAARVVDAIMQATISELARSGFDMLRVDDVAVTAQVNKTTIYRRWPTKVDLVAAALRASHRHLLSLPDTGSVRGDLLALLAVHIDKSRSVEMRSLSRAFLGDVPSPELSRLVTSLRAEYRERWNEVVRRGIARGDLPAGAPVDLVTDLLSSQSVVRMIRNDPPLDKVTRTAMVDLVLAGATVLATSRGDKTRTQVATRGTKHKSRGPSNATKKLP